MGCIIEETETEVSIEFRTRRDDPSGLRYDVFRDGMDDHTTGNGADEDPLSHSSVPNIDA